MFELNCFRKVKELSWDVFYDWLNQLSMEPLPSLPTIRVAISRMGKKQKELSRSKQYQKIHSLFKEPLSVRASETKTAGHDCLVGTAVLDSPLEQVNYELAKELSSTQDALQAECCKTDTLTSQLSKLSIRNVNKKLKRRDQKIHSYESEIQLLTTETKSQAKLIDKFQTKVNSSKCSGERHRVALFRANKKLDTIVEERTGLESKVEDIECKFGEKLEAIEAEIAFMAESLTEAKLDRDNFCERISEIESQKLSTKKNRQLYLDSMRQCCMELLSFNVGIRQVEPVIRSVLRNIALMEVDSTCIPGASTLVKMLAEMKGVACQQLVEELCNDDKLTLHSDGTSKFGQHYVGYQVSTDGSAYSLGLCDMLTQTLSTLKQVLQDIELVSEKGAGEKILSRIKNTMSDRHIVKKKFNRLLEDYRAEILPSAVSNWNLLSEDEQMEVTSLNNFFCGMHLIVGMADTASSTLIQWEESNSSIQDAVSKSSAILQRRSESGTVRLIRTVCKALSKHGSEQSGVYQQFTSFLKSNGIARNPLATFRGNRFNIVFYDAGATYYISPLVEQFFVDVWQTPNQLLKAVLQDLRIPEHLAGCRALGLVNKYVTGPLWRVLESKHITILDMNSRFKTLMSCLDKWALNASEILSGEALLYDDFPPSKDAIYDSLLTPNDNDGMTQEILQVLCSAFSLLVSRLTDDHLPDGRYDCPSENLKKETQSVPKTNTISKRGFAKLDRLLREKPNASTLSLEAIVLFSNNKTASWLQSKPQDEKEKLLRKARLCAIDFKKLYRARKLRLQEQRAEIWRSKQVALQRLREKQLKEKEKLTNDLMLYGLWQSEPDILQGLAKLDSKRDKLNALKTQLNFRKKVLEQQHHNKEVFFFSKKKKQLTVDELTQNLVILVKPLTQASLQSASQQSNETLIGKRICHRWIDSDGSEQWYLGSILSIVSGTDDWFNVKYDVEGEILSLNLLLDVERGDLEFI